MPPEWVASVQTLAEAREFVQRVGICTILENRRDALPSLWDAVDAPDKRPGEGGWGEKMGKVWRWKNELPLTYPDEIFYGKLKGGWAILCTMEHLAELYRQQYKPVERLSSTAQTLYEVIRQGPIPQKELRHAVDMDAKSDKSRFDRALMELQIAFQITRINTLDEGSGPWTTFAAQYPAFMRQMQPTTC
jgi:hypothetical protein